MFDWRRDAEDHARAEAPLESCGLVVRHPWGDRYWPAVNVHPVPTEGFDVAALDWMDAEDSGGEVVAVVHSHPAGGAPSAVDAQAAAGIGLDYHVYDLAADAWHRI